MSDPARCSVPTRTPIRCLTQPQWFFLAVAIPFGLAFVFLTPPVQAPDEGAHLLRSYQLSLGNVISKRIGREAGDVLPIRLSKGFEQFERLRGHSAEKIAIASGFDINGVLVDLNE